MKYQALFKTLLLLLVMVVPTILFTADQTLHSMLTLTSRWLPTSFPERQILEEFKRDFETGDSVLLTWDGCVQANPQLEEIRNRLVQLRDHSSTSYYDTILTSGDVSRALNQLPYPLDPQTVEARQRGLLLGLSDDSQALIVGLTEYGIQNRNDALNQLLSIASATAEIPEEEIFIAGPPVDGWHVDSEAEANLDYLTPPSMLVSALLCFWCLRSGAHSAGVLTAALLTQGIVLATMFLFDMQMSALYIVLPPLVFTLTVSSGIHLANYFQDELRTADSTDAVTKALQHGGGPCLLAAGTTSIGLLSLLASDIIPVTRFGILAALGVMTGLMLLFLLLPGILERWPGRVRTNQSESGFALKFSRGTAVLIVLLSLGVMIGCGVGVSKIQTSVKLDGLFDQDSEIISDYEYLEDRFGPLVPAAAAEAAALQQLALQTEMVEKLGEELQSMRLVHADDTSEIWRISTRVPALGDVDYATALDNLKQTIQSTVAEASIDTTEVEVEFTGIMPMVSRVQQVLLHDLFVSFISAFGLVAIVVMIVLRTFWGGLLAMLPNVFPALVIFGLMGWLSIPVDIGAMMTASVALGIAVDDTFHFLIWYQRGLSEGHSSADAVTFAYHRCAKAMVQTTLICGLGMAVFGLSGFLPTQRFAALIATMLMTALIGDLIFLPALLRLCNKSLFMPKSAQNPR